MRNGSYKIGEAAKRLDMNPRTIRFYESAGLLSPPKRTEHDYASAGHRLFSPQDLRRLQFVRQARLLDLSLDQIRELGEITEEGCCGRARPHLKALIREKLPELRRRIAELRRLERHLKILERTFRTSLLSSIARAMARWISAFPWETKGSFRSACRRLVALG